jgi:hypothetical protein
MPDIRIESRPDNCLGSVLRLSSLPRITSAPDSAERIDNTQHARQSLCFQRMIESLITLYDASGQCTGSGSFGDGFHAIAYLLSGPDNVTGQPAVSP